MNDEKPMAIRTPAFVALMISMVVEKWEAISGIVGRREVLE
jgi:hypothetical protein